MNLYKIGIFDRLETYCVGHWSRWAGAKLRGNTDRYDKGPDMKITRTGSAAWQGGLKDGKGSISTQSGALSAYPYGFASRFEGVKGSNPEELIAAAHASCFTMALSLILGNAGFVADRWIPRRRSRSSRSVRASRSPLRI